MIVNEDKNQINTSKTIPLRIYHILENMYFILPSILNNYIRAYYY